MNWLKKVIASVVLGLTLVGSFAATPQADASPVAHANQHIYWVYYRTSTHGSWTCYGGYYQAHQAQQAVNWFRSHGYDSFYRS